MPTTAQVRSVFAALKTGALSSAAVSCVYQGDSFTGIRSSLETDINHTLYGEDSDYDFSVYVELSELTTDVKTDERITITGDFGTSATSPMRVIGSQVDSVSGLVRLDVGSLFQ
tara:strand:- start:851 stop:1192 length:342 start_codon:yes stop_codon:yes gene_type:complete